MKRKNDKNDISNKRKKLEVKTIKYNNKVLNEQTYTFKTLYDANKHSKQNNTPVLALEKRDMQARTYISSTYQTFFNKFETYNKENKLKMLRYHEIVQSNRYVKIYFDIETEKGVNENFDFEKSCHYIAESMCDYIKTHYDIELDVDKNVTYLSASRDNKYSMHIIFDDTCVVENVEQLSWFIKMFEYHIIKKEQWEINKTERKSYNPVFHGGNDKRISILAFDKYNFPSEDGKVNESLCLLQPMIDHHVYQGCSLRTYYSLSNSHNNNEAARLREYNNSSFSLDTLKRSLIQYIENDKEINVIKVNAIQEDKLEDAKNLLLMRYNKDLAIHSKDYTRKFKKDDKGIVDPLLKKLARENQNNTLYQMIGKSMGDSHLYLLKKTQGEKNIKNNDKFADCNTMKTTKCDIKIESPELKKLLQDTILNEYSEESPKLFDGLRIIPIITKLSTNTSKDLLIIGLKNTRCEIVRDLKPSKRHNNKGKQSKFDSGQYFVLNLVKGVYYQKCFHTKCSQSTQRDNKKISRKGHQFNINLNILSEIKKLYELTNK